MVARSKCQRVVWIEIEVEIRPEVCTTASGHAEPFGTRLQAEAAACKSVGGQLQRRLNLNGPGNLDRSVGADPGLSAEKLIAVHAKPCVRAAIAPAKV